MKLASLRWKHLLLGFGLVASGARAAVSPSEAALASAWARGFRSATNEELRIRAEAAEKAGLFHVALGERLKISRSGRGTLADLDRLAKVAFYLDRLEVMPIAVRAAGATQIGALPASARIALAAYALRLGDGSRAARYLPAANELNALPEGIRAKALHISAIVDVQRGRLENAYEKYGAALAGARRYEASFARVQRARLLYDMGRFTPALEELMGVPKNTPHWFPGVIVAAWSGYRVKDDNLVLGQLMTLHSPYLMTRFAPETHLLEAATLFRLCHYESAKRSLQNLKGRYEKLPGLLSRFKGKYGSRFAQVSSVLNFARGATGDLQDFTTTEGRMLIDGLLSDETLTEVDRSLTQASTEMDALERLAREGGASVTAIVNGHRAEIEAARREYYRNGVKAIQRRLDKMNRDVGEAMADAVAVEVEVDTRLRNRLVRRQTAVMKEVDFETEIKKGYEFWPFHGEFWRDEVGGYAFATTDVCAAGERGPESR